MTQRWHHKNLHNKSNKSFVFQLLPSIITFPQFTALGSLIPVFFVFSLPYRCIAFLLISCINPSSNHSFELFITEFFLVYGWVHVKNNKLHFCLVDLSFANLICRASTNRPKTGRGNTVFFPSGSDGKESACNVGEPGSIPGSGRSPGEGNGYPLQYSCLGNPMDRGAWWATVHRVTKSQTGLSN